MSTTKQVHSLNAIVPPSAICFSSNCRCTSSTPLHVHLHLTLFHLHSYLVHHLDRHLPLSSNSSVSACWKHHCPSSSSHFPAFLIHDLVIVVRLCVVWCKLLQLGLTLASLAAESLGAGKMLRISISSDTVWSSCIHTSTCLLQMSGWLHAALLSWSVTIIPSHEGCDCTRSFSPLYSWFNNAAKTNVYITIKWMGRIVLDGGIGVWIVLLIYNPNYTPWQYSRNRVIFDINCNILVCFWYSNLTPVCQPLEDDIQWRARPVVSGSDLW